MQSPRKGTKTARKRTGLRGSGVSARIVWKDFHSGMVIIRGRELKMHERELRGSEVSRGDFNPGVITFDVILILCDSASL